MNIKNRILFLFITCIMLSMCNDLYVKAENHCKNRQNDVIDGICFVRIKEVVDSGYINYIIGELENNEEIFIYGTHLPIEGLTDEVDLVLYKFYPMDLYIDKFHNNSIDGLDGLIAGPEVHRILRMKHYIARNIVAGKYYFPRVNVLNEPESSVKNTEE